MDGDARYPAWPNCGAARIVLTVLFLLSSFALEMFGDDSEAQDKFVITGAEFYRRSQLDTGEIRIFLKNAGKEPLSISQCKLSRFIAN